MRILYTHRTRGVGAEGAHIRGMYEAFRELGHDVSMHCLPGCNPSERAGAETRKHAAESRPQAAPGTLARIYGAIADRAPQILFECIELAYNGVLLFQLGRRCLRSRPALIYERYSLNTFAPSLLCRMLGIKHVLEVNDSVVIERSRPLRLKGISSFLEGVCLGASDLSITITGRFRNRLLERFRVAPERVLVLTNGVARVRFAGPFDREGVRKRLGLNGSTVLGGTGQFLEWHGLQDLVEQMGPVARDKNLRFLFVGDGPARKDVMEKAAALGIGDRVHFTGMLPIDAVPDHLAALDMAVIPKAAPHASPMKLIEYMAMGLPIVSPDLPSIREALVEGTMGKIFPAGEMGLMREAILALLADKAAAAAAGREAREYVLSHLTWDRHAREVLHALGFPEVREGAYRPG